MADSEQSYAAILAVLADDQWAGISAEDIRQAIISALGGYGMLSVVDGATVQTGLDATAQKLTCFTTATPADPNSNVVPDATNDQITVAVAGVYEAHLGLSFTLSGTAAIEFGVAVDGTPTNVRMERNIATPYIGEGCSGIGAVSAGQTITAYAKLLSGSSNVTVKHGTLWLKRVG